MNGIIMAAQLLLGLSILIILHELGHFLAARAFGIRVEKFYLFFDAWGVKLFKVTYKGCEYGIGWLPLGGYVKISGMIDESMDKDQLAGPPQPWEFRSKPAWQRLIVMLGGVTVNVILGIFIFWMLTFAYGEQKMPLSSLRNGISPGIVGRDVGLKPGDKVVSVNGTAVTYLEDVASPDVMLGNSELGILRNGKTLSITLPEDMIGKVSDHGVLEFVAPRYTSTADSVIRSYPGYKAGLRKGDRVIALNGAPIRFYDQLRDSLQGYKSKKVALGVLRGEDTLTLSPLVTKEGQIGYYPNFKETREDTLKHNLFAALPIGAGKAWGSLVNNAKGLGKIFTRQLDPQKGLSGPIAIAGLYGGEFEWINFWRLTGLLSMALALMNILPIPALDGGHVLFLLIEMVKGKPLSDRVLERAQIAGFFVLIALMIFVFGNDIIKLMNK